jgi:hypothetical protein
MKFLKELWDHLFHPIDWEKEIDIVFENLYKWADRYLFK